MLDRNELLKYSYPPAPILQSSVKTDILQKIRQRGNNHQENETALGKITNELITLLRPSVLM